MEKFQGPINPCLTEEDLDVDWLEEFVSNLGSNNKFEDLYNEESAMLNLEDEIPFLQMLQGVETSAGQTSALFPVMHEPNYFQLLLRLEHQKMHNFSSNFSSPNNKNDMIMDLQFPAKSETGREEVEEQIHAEISPEQCIDENHKAKCRSNRPNLPKTSSNLEGVGERKKRKRPSKAYKNNEEAETQRMSHIAVERNRRRQMNDHLNALRSLMPPSYAQRGDQASIIGGAIDFVKELEQILQSFGQTQKRIRHQPEENNMFVTSPTSTFQFRNFDFNNKEGYNGNSTQVRRNNNNEEFSAENRSDLADIKVVVIQNHVNLKIQCQRRPGQLVKVIVAFEELRLTILHLNITSLDTLVHYSFNLKIEDDCKLGSADEVLRAVHHIFSMINLS